MSWSVNHIEVGYNVDNILKDVSLCVQKKKFVGLIGPNGSGKSTLLKCMYRVLEPKSGSILLENEDIRTMRYKQSAKKIAVVAQHNEYEFDFSVKEIVLMGRSPYKTVLQADTKKDNTIVEEALAMVGMSAFANRTFSTLSGGEQQRVIVARALAQQSPYIVLDEPTNHLDITHQMQLFRLIKQLDVTVIAAIHDLNIAAKFCDTIYVLKDGSVVASGAPRDVLTPKLIREVYEVECEIVEDTKQQMHILFL